MPLTPGTRLGPYEIVSPIGAGGMGEVYRARDTRLDRAVAIKTVSGVFSERFEREARAISALNHPHICTLHDVGTEQGVSFLVMEHVDGAELRGPLPPDQAIRHAIQICGGLEAAHRAGIVHRDLKPANILVTKQGVKLLDFGIAKLQPAKSSGPAAADATVAVLTGAHTVIGTPQYMAPEQIEGRDADARTDIFAFGCVLYEMLTGTPAFDGKSPSSVMAAILASEPRPMRELQPVTPPALERVVSLCLAKDPGERYQSAHDVRLHLEAIRDGALQPVAAATPATRPIAWKERATWAALLALALAGAVGVVAFMRTPPAVAPLRVAVNLPPGFSLDAANSSLALSPDGQRLAISASGPTASQRLWIRSLAGDQPQPIQGTDGATYPFWSPDGRAVGFFAAQKLRKVEVASGAVQTICDAPNGRGAAWGPDGVIVFAPDYQAGLQSVAASGGAPVALTHPEPGGTHRMPSFLPDGRHVLFYSGKADQTPEGIMSLDLASKQVERIAAEPNEGRYVPPGFLLFLRGSNLMAQPFDAASRRTNGSPQIVAENVSSVPNRYSGQYAMAGTGVLVYQQNTGLPARQLTMFGADGTRIGAIGDPGSFVGQVFLSPNGRRAVVPIREVDTTACWIFDLTTGVRTRLAAGGPDSPEMAWSPDGSSLAYGTGDGSIWTQSIGVSGRPRALLTPQKEFTTMVNAWSPDGRSLALLRQRRDGIDLVELPLHGKPDLTPLVEGPGWQMAGAYAPDGKAFAYISNETGVYEVFVMGLPKSGGKLQVTSGGGEHPQWLNGGRELAYVNPQRELVVVEMPRSGDQLTVGRSRKLFGGRPLPAQPGLGGDREGASPVYITPDGTRILLAVPTNLDAVVPLTLVTNWR